MQADPPGQISNLQPELEVGCRLQDVKWQIMNAMSDDGVRLNIEPVSGRLYSQTSGSGVNLAEVRSTASLWHNMTSGGNKENSFWKKSRGVGSGGNQTFVASLALQGASEDMLPSQLPDRPSEEFVMTPPAASMKGVSEKKKTGKSEKTKSSNHSRSSSKSRNTDISDLLDGWYRDPLSVLHHGFNQAQRTNIVAFFTL